VTYHAGKENCKQQTPVRVTSKSCVQRGAATSEAPLQQLTKALQAYFAVNFAHVTKLQEVKELI